MTLESDDKDGIPAQARDPSPLPTLAIVHNNKVRKADYRVQLYLHSQTFRILLMAPGRPDAVRETDFVKIQLREGFALSDVAGFASLFRELWLRRHMISLCHFFSTKLLLVGPMLATLCGIPSVITITGFGRVFSKPRPLFLMLRIPYIAALLVSTSLAKLVFCQNRGHEEKLKKWLPWCRKKIYYIGSGVLFPVYERVAPNLGKLRVLCVTRLIAAKGVGTFLDAAEASAGLHEFVLIGTRSPGSDALYERIQDCAQRGVVKFLGEVQGDDLVAEYRRSDIFLFPGAYGEGLSRVLVEAALSGLIAIAVDTSANRDLVADPAMGYLLPDVTVQAIGEILEKLSKDRASLFAMSKAFQKHVANRYDMRTFLQGYEKAIAELLQSSSGQLKWSNTQDHCAEAD